MIEEIRLRLLGIAVFGGQNQITVRVDDMRKALPVERVYQQKAA